MLHYIMYNARYNVENYKISKFLSINKISPKYQKTYKFQMTKMYDIIYKNSQ